LQQKGLDRFGLLLENFFDQVIQDVPITAGESVDESGDVFLLLD